ncbi:MAG TPA: GntR family transcriptional regulator, partial [Pseudogracilibacillus sp.]|nr:GntR family transcriptional regulator [Pseudogracilibacillus sp.]
MSKNLDLRISDREMLHNKVCSVLRRAILKGDFKPGQRLVQTELAELIGVSRMPIREALRTLEIEGLVTLEPHKGAVVRTINKKDIEES